MRPDTGVRGTNPWCARLRFVLLPLMLVPLWFGQMLAGLMVMGAWMILPRLFRKPTTDAAWITRAALGVEIWRSRPFEAPAVLLWFLAAAAALLAGGIGAWTGQPWPAVGGGGLFVLLQFLMLLSAARVYSSRKRRPILPE